MATKPKLPALLTETEALMTAVERMARDPSVDPQKVREFLELRKELLADAAKVSYARAFDDLQMDLPTLPARGVIPHKGRNKRPDGTWDAKDVKSKYVRWEDAIEILRPILHSHGFSLSHRINTVPPAMQVSSDGRTAMPIPGSGSIEVTSVLLHREGHSNQTTFSLPVDVNEYRNKVQDYASTVSYGKRYTAFALLGLVGSDEVDTDAETPAGDTISLEQMETIEALCAELSDPDGKAFINYMNKKHNLKCAQLADLPAERFDEMIKTLESAKAKRGIAA